MIHDPRSMIHEKGQVMLITVLTLGGLLLAVTTIGGLLMTYQIRQSSDITNSTKAIIAADAGIEWELYKIKQANSTYPQIQFTNNASVATTCKLADGTDCKYDGNDLDAGVTIKSIGNSSRIYRAFEMTLQEQTQ